MFLFLVAFEAAIAVVAAVAVIATVAAVAYADANASAITTWYHDLYTLRVNIAADANDDVDTDSSRCYQGHRHR